MPLKRRLASAISSVAFGPNCSSHAMNENNMKLNDDIASWLSGVRKNWYQKADPFGAGRPVLFPKYPAIDQSQLDGARVFTDRVVAMQKYFAAGGKGIEVGTQTGNFAKLIFELTSPAEMVLLDISDEYIKATNPEILEHNEISLIIGDSAISLPKLKQNYYDWIYIDANHDYDGVKKDLINASKLVKPGGLIALNDYTIWSPLEMWPYGVVEAVHEFLSDNSWQVEYIALGEQGYADIAIRRPS